ncbi:nucleolar protein 58 [Cyclospora cayetanensis]|uniref:Nucleolar protein 58 n=1 Tax=Cyclospora cayetanensis TaxID=88456 RepID=A0A6P6S488_9EIME|nr:nucleolar protein 58 [Cyclospora cayetanensis]
MVPCRKALSGNTKLTDGQTAQGVVAVCARHGKSHALSALSQTTATAGSAAGSAWTFREQQETNGRMPRDDSEEDESSSSSSSSSSSDTSEDERHRRKKEKRAKKHSKKSKSKKHEGGHAERKRKSAKSAKKKKKKKQKDKVALGAVGDRWGRYGIIHDTDMWAKRPEFTLWLLEVKNRNIEELANWEEKRLFSDFAEDFNTATLPHKKYYNLELWEAEERMRQAQKEPVHRERTEFNDEVLRMKEIRKLREERKQLATAQELQNLRRDRDKVMDMREQRLMATKVETLYKLGRNAEAEALAERLKPDT